MLLYYTLLNISFISTDVAVPGLNRDYAYSKIIIVPNKNIKEIFENIVNPLHKQIYCLEKYNNFLVSARDILLPRLMSGEIEV